MTEFREDVQEGLNALPEASDLVTKMNNYNNTSNKVVDKHAN